MRLRFNRHKTFSTVLNVIGLTLAFSVFLILTVQVVYDTRYDLNYPDTDKIVRLEYSDPTSPGVYGVQLSRPFIENLKTFFPQAEAVSCYWYYKNGNRSPFKLRYTQTDFDLLRVFPFEFIEGDTSGYRAPGTAVISQKAAAKIFGSQSPVGKDIQYDIKSGDGSSWRIVAVYKDFPDNSSMDNDLLLNLGDYSMTDYSEWSYPCYMKMNTFEGVEPLLDSLGAMMFGEDSEFKDQVDFRLSHLHDAYYARDVEGDNMAKGNRSTTMTLLTVSILVLLIAIINFVNFAMASVPFSIKSINTRRVIGSTRGQQIWAQLWRALGLVLLAFALSVGMMSLAATSSIASNISGSLRVADNLPIILIGLGVAVVTAFIAGIFPARYSTSFNPAMVLKGSFSLSAKGRKMRSVLVGFQYVISLDRKQPRDPQADAPGESQHHRCHICRRTGGIPGQDGLGPHLSGPESPDGLPPRRSQLHQLLRHADSRGPRLHRVGQPEPQRHFHCQPGLHGQIPLPPSRSEILRASG